MPVEVGITGGGARHIWEFPGDEAALRAAIREDRIPVHLHREWELGPLRYDGATREVQQTPFIDVVLSLDGGSPFSAVLYIHDEEVHWAWRNRTIPSGENVPTSLERLQTLAQELPVTVETTGSTLSRLAIRKLDDDRYDEILSLSCTFHARTIQLPPEGLDALLAHTREGVESLVVTGDLDAVHVRAMRERLPNLESVTCISIEAWPEVSKLLLKNWPEEPAPTRVKRVVTTNARAWAQGTTRPFHLVYAGPANHVIPALKRHGATGRLDLRGAKNPPHDFCAQIAEVDLTRVAELDVRDLPTPPSCLARLGHRLPKRARFRRGLKLPDPDEVNQYLCKILELDGGLDRQPTAAELDTAATPVLRALFTTLAELASRLEVEVGLKQFPNDIETATMRLKEATSELLESRPSRTGPITRFLRWVWHTLDLYDELRFVRLDPGNHDDVQFLVRDLEVLQVLAGAMLTCWRGDGYDAPVKDPVRLLKFAGPRQ